jgi:hypothetical protein
MKPFKEFHESLKVSSSKIPYPLAFGLFSLNQLTLELHQYQLDQGVQAFSSSFQDAWFFLEQFFCQNQGFTIVSSLSLKNLKVEYPFDLVLYIFKPQAEIHPLS